MICMDISAILVEGTVVAVCVTCCNINELRILPTPISVFTVSDKNFIFPKTPLSGYL